MNEQDKMSRRRMVAGLGTTIAAAAVVPAFGGMNNNTTENLKIITSTTRPGAKGIKIAEWITGLASTQGSFNVELLDLAQINLPFMDEPEHPSLQKYQHEHTKQ